MSKPYLSVIIPAYNEAARIVPTLEQVVAYLRQQTYSWEVVVVDDGSTDATAALAAGLCDGVPLHLLQVPHGGKGWAVQHGMLQAQGQYRFLCDADLSMPIEHLALFLPPALDDYDIAIGSREAPGARRFHEPARRHLMGRAFNLLVHWLAVPDFADTQCGFKCFRGEVAEVIFPLQRLRGFGFDVELLFLARRRGYRVVEVPIDWYYRVESKVHPLRDTFSMVRDVLSVRWSQWRGRYDRDDTTPPEGHSPTG